MPEAKGRRFFSFSIRSLTVRVTFFSTLWVLVALVVMAWVAALLYRDTNERNFEDLLTSQLYSLIGFVNVSPRGALQGTPELGGVQYGDPTSGWYWEVQSVSANLRGHLRSPSLGSHMIASPSLEKQPFDKRFMRSYRARGRQGQDILVVEGDVKLEARGPVARFRVMGNLAEVQQRFVVFRQTMRRYLLGLGLISMVINGVIIIVGLYPLVRVRRGLAAIRNGEADRIPAGLPVEIAPLAQEMNALIDNNRRIVDRFRTQVGNLAHAMKTPLAVIVNAAGRMKGKDGQLVSEQARAMQLQINHYLQRAHIAAQRDSVVYRTPVQPVIERMVRVMAKLHPARNIVFAGPETPVVFAGEAEDIEEIIGNLLENAAKWARRTVKITLDASAEQGSFCFCVEDDGPGLGTQQMREAVKRGRRFDESKPGSGLGLAIVVDTVYEYDGVMQLERSAMGGLRAVIRLPLAAD